jgi:hypothetical protein
MKFDCTRVRSTAALSKPDMGPQSIPSARAANIRYAPCKVLFRTAVISASIGCLNACCRTSARAGNRVGRFVAKSRSLPMITVRHRSTRDFWSCAHHAGIRHAVALACDGASFAAICSAIAASMESSRAPEVAGALLAGLAAGRADHRGRESLSTPRAACSGCAEISGLGVADTTRDESLSSCIELGL